MWMRSEAMRQSDCVMRILYTKCFYGKLRYNIQFNFWLKREKKYKDYKLYIGDPDVIKDYRWNKYFLWTKNILPPAQEKC